MLTKILLSAALVAAAAGVGSAPAALAEAPVIHAPDEVYPGRTLSLSVVCPNMDWQPVRSDVLEAPIVLTPQNDVDGWGYGDGTVIADATVGATYTLTYGCGTEEATHQVRVASEPTSGPVGLTIEPQTARPGAQVTLSGQCYKTNNLYPFSSPALDPAQWQRRDTYLVVAQTTVRNVQPGRYEVSFRCGGKTVQASFTVLGAGPGAQPAPPPGGQVQRKPKGAPETGGGMPVPAVGSAWIAG